MAAGSMARSPASAPPVPGVVCPDGATTEGIDVSYYQGAISWTEVAADGVEFAFIRVSDGLDYEDSRFDQNWAGARSAGVIRGAYQYFRVGQDAAAQAELLLDHMGPLEDGDLPPVIDVETYGNDGYSSSEVTAAVGEWIAVVEAALGVQPIIYTSYGAWSSMSGSSDFADYPLWTASWYAHCPWVPDQWSAWEFWQYTDMGSVAGIVGAVDRDLFNGDLAALQEFAVGEDSDPGDGCCAVADGATVVAEEDGPCAYLSPWGSSYQDIDGHGGHAYQVTVDVAEPDYGEGLTYCFEIEATGAYDLQAWIPDAATELASDSLYKITDDGGSHYVYLNQAVHRGGWAQLERLSARPGQLHVRLGDNYRQDEQRGRNLAFDALRVVPPSGTVDTDGPADCACDEPGATEQAACPDGGYRNRSCDGCDWSPWSECPEIDQDSSPDDSGWEPDEGGCGCAGAASGGWAVLGLLGLLGLRRRRPAGQ